MKQVIKFVTVPGGFLPIKHRNYKTKAGAVKACNKLANKAYVVDLAASGHKIIHWNYSV